MVYQALAIDPLDQSRKDGSCLVDSFNGAGAANRAANILFALYARFLLLRWHEAPTIRARRICALMFLAIRCAPLIYQIFMHERLATIGTARSNALAKTLCMIWFAIMNIKTGIEYRFMAGSTKEVLRVPVGSQGIDVVTPDRLFTFFANWIR